MDELREVTVSRGEGERGNVIFQVESPKRKSKFYIQKSEDGFVFYEVVVEKGRLPSALRTKFTSPDKALKAVTEYLRTSKDSITVERDRKYEKLHAPTVQPDDKEQVQQGTSD